jgi:hypothetical protein
METGVKPGSVCSASSDIKKSILRRVEKLAVS